MMRNSTKEPTTEEEGKNEDFCKWKNAKVHTQDLSFNWRIQKFKKILLANIIPNSLNMNENYVFGI